MFQIVCFYFYLGYDIKLYMEILGEHYFNLCNKRYKRAFGCLGTNLQDFMSTFDGLQEVLRKCIFDFQFGLVPIPSFRCYRVKDSLMIDYHITTGENIKYFVIGVIQELTRQLFHNEIEMKLVELDKAEFHYSVKLRKFANDIVVSNHLFNIPSQLSVNAKDLKISVKAMCRLLPWHFIFDRQIVFQQLGNALTKVLGNQIKQKGADLHVAKYFIITRPKVSFSNFQEIKSRSNAPFHILFVEDVLTGHFQKLKVIII